MRKKMIVAGASGFVGAATVRQCVHDGWQVIGLSRSIPAHPVPGADYAQVDLRDASACASLAERHPDVSHIAYAAINETAGGLVAGWSDPHHAARNGQMFANLLDAVIAQGAPLQHVTAVHGAKAYGTNRLSKTPIPLKERMPRPAGDDFYFRQEDCLWDRAAKHGFGWTTFRPALIVGGGTGSNLSSLLALAVYALLWRAQGQPVPFPGAPEPHGVNQMTDVTLLAQAISWAGTAPKARNQIFNITNGDVFTGQDMWPIFLEALGAEIAPASPQSIEAYVRAHAHLWCDIVLRDRLAVSPDPFAFLGESFALADYTLPKAGRSIVMSTIALQQAGFTQCLDSADSIRRWIEEWRRLGLLPPRLCTAAHLGA